MHWTTLEEILEYPSSPGYRRSKRPERPKIDPYVDRIRQILAQDQHIHKKQRHTAKRISERLQEEGFTGGYLMQSVRFGAHWLRQKGRAGECHAALRW